MIDPSPSSLPTPPQTDRLTDRVARSSERWQRLGMVVSSITPSELARTALVAVAALILGWLVMNAWQSLVPFFVGAIIAYALLPVVNSLDRFMPRTLAAILSLFTLLGLVVLVIVRAVPVVANQALRFIQTLPPREVLQAQIAQLTARLGDLPPAQQQAITTVVNQLWLTIQTNALAYLTSLVTFSTGTIMNFVSVIGFILGLVVIPTWMLSVMTGQRQGAIYLNRVLPAWLKPDFWAIAYTIDKPLRAYFNGLSIVGLAAGVLMGLGAWTLDAIGVFTFRLPGVLGIVTGLLQLIPTVGPAIGYIILLLIGLLISPRVAIVLVLLYWVVQQLVGTFVEPRFQRKVVDIHPALLAIVVVVLSQVGLFWVLFAAPLTAIFRDLFRYLYGRLGDPARPAPRTAGERRVLAAQRLATRPAPRYVEQAAERRAKSTRNASYRATGR